MSSPALLFQRTEPPRSVPTPEIRCSSSKLVAQERITGDHARVEKPEEDLGVVARRVECLTDGPDAVVEPEA
jgi:hypothetical protein